MDCNTVRETNVHGDCANCGSRAVCDNEGRATVDAAALAQIEQHVEWLDWAERTINDATRRT